MTIEFNTTPFSWVLHGQIYDLWFEKRKAEKPMKEIVSPTGLVVTANGTPVCIGFLCKTDSRVALITNFISDPDFDKEIRSDCLDVLVEALSNIAKNEGFIIVGASSPVPAMIERYRRLGFIQTHEQITNFGRFYAMDSNSSSSDRCDFSI